MALKIQPKVQPTNNKIIMLMYDLGKYGYLELQVSSESTCKIYYERGYTSEQSGYMPDATPEEINDVVLKFFSNVK